MKSWIGVFVFPLPQRWLGSTLAMVRPSKDHKIKASIITCGFRRKLKKNKGGQIDPLGIHFHILSPPCCNIVEYMHKCF